MNISCGIYKKKKKKNIIYGSRMLENKERIYETDGRKSNRFVGNFCRSKHGILYSLEFNIKVEITQSRIININIFRL